jgi:hypothetical protein
MELVYTLVMYGLAATMIFFIATITAGIVLGMFLMLASLAHKIRGPRHATARRVIHSPRSRSTEARV